MTHGITFLSQVDNILVMIDGRVSETGSYQDLLRQNGAFAEFLRNYSLEDIIEDDDGTSTLLVLGPLVFVCVCAYTIIKCVLVLQLCNALICLVNHSV